MFLTMFDRPVMLFRSKMISSCSNNNSIVQVSVEIDTIVPMVLLHHHLTIPSIILLNISLPHHPFTIILRENSTLHRANHSVRSTIIDDIHMPSIALLLHPQLLVKRMRTKITIVVFNMFN